MLDLYIRRPRYRRLVDNLFKDSIVSKQRKMQDIFLYIFGCPHKLQPTMKYLGRKIVFFISRMEIKCVQIGIDAITLLLQHCLSEDELFAYAIKMCNIEQLTGHSFNKLLIEARNVREVE